MKKRFAIPLMYLFAAGAGLLLGEAVVANRLSKRFGFGLS